jgi:hypothetical protein
VDKAQIACLVQGGINLIGAGVYSQAGKSGHMVFALVLAAVFFWAGC